MKVKNAINDIKKILKSVDIGTKESIIFCLIETFKNNKDNKNTIGRRYIHIFFLFMLVKSFIMKVEK